jgi:lysophospholipase L1-like esterase
MLMKKTILVYLTLVVFGCAEPNVNFKELSSTAIILAFGDSLTYGTGVSDEEAYPSILARLTFHEVVNEGIPGEISRDGANRLPRLLDEIQPELLILIHGGNDILRKIPRAETANNLGKMIAEARQRDIAVLLLGVPEPKLFITSSADIYQTIAKQYGIAADLSTLPEILSDRDLKSDMVHPNAKGYSQMAENIYSLLKRTGAL